MTVNGNSTTDPHIISECLNTFISTISEKLTSRIVEKHVTKHLFAYLKRYDILHKSQSGFRKSHSCNTALHRGPTGVFLLLRS